MTALFDRLDFIHDTAPHSGALNMAIDEALCLATTSPTLRVYRWTEPSVSFGYFGRWREVLERWPGRAPIRRWTGGGEVPHGEDFTYTLIVPREHPFCRMGVRESYGAIHRVLATLLPDSALADSDAAAATACFARPVVFDVLVGGAKVAGAAQRRGRHGLLHQGSIQGAAFAQDLADRIAGAFSSGTTYQDLPSALLAAANRLAEEKYATKEWLERV